MKQVIAARLEDGNTFSGFYLGTPHGWTIVSHYEEDVYIMGSVRPFGEPEGSTRTFAFHQDAMIDVLEASDLPAEKSRCTCEQCPLCRGKGCAVCRETWGRVSNLNCPIHGFPGVQAAQLTESDDSTTD
jgi:hypothetical protein